MMAAIDLLTGMIKRFEGCRLRAYRCPAGVLTCGYGSTGPDITPNTVWTQTQANNRMTLDAQRFLAGSMVLCPGLNAQQAAAVADFAYNCGLTRLKGSTLRRKILRGDMQGAALEFGKWTRGGGRVLPGLVVRREAERRLFLS